MSTEQAQDQQQDSGKEEKKFINFRKQLVALLGGDKLLKKGTRVNASEMTAIMEELTKERREAKAAEIKKDIMELIDGSIAFDSFRRAEEDKFKKAVTEKHKEFNKKAEGIMAKVTDLKEMVDTYYTALRDAATPSEETGTASSGEGTQS